MKYLLPISSIVAGFLLGIVLPESWFSILILMIFAVAAIIVYSTGWKTSRQRHISRTAAYISLAAMASIYCAASWLPFAAVLGLLTFALYMAYLTYTEVFELQKLGPSA